MTSPDVKTLIRRSARRLSARAPVDPYLLRIARRFASHRFLGNCAQGVYARQVAFLAELLPGYFRKSPAEIRVLDWGCGKGHISYLLRRQGFYVVSCDRAELSHDSAFGQETPILDESGIEVVPLTDPVRLPFDDGTFDCVTSFGVLEHVPGDSQSLLEIRRILKAGGLLYISFLPYHLSWTQRFARLGGDSYHERLYSSQHVRQLAAAARFEVAGMWLAQLLPKNSVPLKLDPILEPLDRVLCKYTPLRYIATNLEAVLRAI